MSIVIYGDHRSGNCLKVKWACRTTRRSLSLDRGRCRGRRDPHARSSWPSIPPARSRRGAEDGRTLAQSNAHHAAPGRGPALIPADPYDRARMYEWLFWEQYSHEPYIAVARFQMAYLGKPRESSSPGCSSAARRRWRGWSGRSRIAPGWSARPDPRRHRPGRLHPGAHEGGFDLADYPAVAGLDHAASKQRAEVSALTSAALPAARMAQSGGHDTPQARRRRSPPWPLAAPPARRWPGAPPATA